VTLPHEQFFFFPTPPSLSILQYQKLGKKFKNWQNLAKFLGKNGQGLSKIMKHWP
jgi:hypothetical protein